MLLVHSYIVYKLQYYKEVKLLTAYAWYLKHEGSKYKMALVQVPNSALNYGLHDVEYPSTPPSHVQPPRLQGFLSAFPAEAALE